MLEYITWNIDPEIFTIGERGIRWYGLLLAIGFYLAYLVLAKMLSKEGFSEKKINYISLFIIVGTILGLRLGHVLFYGPYHTEAGTGYFDDPVSILYVWQGGLASHGGAIGILLAIALFAIKYRISYLGILDRVVVIVPLAGAFVRIGNLMNSEIVGKVTDVPWAFYFPWSDCRVIEGCDFASLPPRHPTQIYEALFYFALFAVMFLIYRRQNGKIKEGFLLGVFMILLFGFRFIIEFLKDVQEDFENDMIINMGQTLSLPFIGIGILLMVIALSKGRYIDFSAIHKSGNNKENKEITTK